MKKPRVTARWVHSRTRSVLDYHGSYAVKVDGKEVGTVQHCRDPFSENKARRAGYWIFYATIVIDGKEVTRNSAWTKEDWDTAELARDACIAWIKGVIDEHLERSRNAAASPDVERGDAGEALGSGGAGDPRDGQ